MDASLIFTYKYKRLTELLKGGDAIQLLDVSAILREFLIDHPNIVDEVNRDLKFKLRFAVPESSRVQYDRVYSPGTIFLVVMAGAGITSESPRTMVSRDQFLKHEIISFQNMHFTVRQVIKACANQFGGKHYGDSSKDDQELSALRYLDTHMRVAGDSGVFNALRFIGEIAVEGLRQLYQVAQDPIELMRRRWLPGTNA